MRAGVTRAPPRPLNGYAFEQNFYDGFDVRNLNETGSISDEPYIGIQLLSRF